MVTLANSTNSYETQLKEKKKGYSNSESNTYMGIAGLQFDRAIRSRSMSGGSSSRTQ